MTSSFSIQLSYDSFFRLKESPWAWACRTGRGCVKVPKDLAAQEGDDMSNPTLAGCKLTCDPHATLWPRPRDATFLSRNLVTFNPTDIRLKRVSAPTPKVLFHFYYIFTWAQSCSRLAHIV